MQDIQVKRLQVVCEDNYVITAYRYEAAIDTQTKNIKIKGGVLIVPAMGVPQSYYKYFANWLAGLGFIVYTFDYRGMGESLYGPLKHVKTDMVLWGQQDVQAVLGKLQQEMKDLPIYWIGHSLGGHLLPFVNNKQGVVKAITIASGSGYWKQNSWPTRRIVPLMWYVAVPLTVDLFGYFPGKKLNMVGNLPKGVIKQWRKWSLHPQYSVGAEGENFAQLYASQTIPLDILFFTDDDIMSETNVRSLHGFYSNAPKTWYKISPSQVGVKHIKHFGYFNKRMQPVWEQTLLMCFNATKLPHI